MHAEPRTVDIAYRQATRPRLLVGIGLALLSVLGWLGQRTSINVLVSLALVSLAAYLISSGRRRQRRVRIELPARTIESSRYPEKLRQIERIDLVARAGELEGRPRASFCAEAVTRQGARYEIYEAPDPAELLRWGREMDAALPVHVTWISGHPRMKEWLESQGTPGSRAAAPRRLVGQPYARQSKVSRLLFGIAAAMGISWTLFLVQSKASIAPLSVALALGALGFILLTATLVATDRATVEIAGGNLLLERRRLGMSLSRRLVPLAEIVRTSALKLDPEAGYLLLLTDDEAFSLPLTEPTLSAAAQALSA